MSTLRLSGIHMSDDDVTPELLGEHTDVYLSGNDISDRGACVIAAWLKTRTATVRLRNNKIGDIGAAALCKAVYVSKSRVDLGYNNVSERGFGKCAKIMLANLDGVTRFTLVGNPGASTWKTYVGALAACFTQRWIWDTGEDGEKMD